MCNSNDDNNTSDNTQNIDNQQDTPLKTVRLFIESLNEQDFVTAYNLQQISQWGDINNFSSKNAFGGITSVEINAINNEPDENGYSVVFVDASYTDPTNGDNRYKEKFYLKKIDDNWIIVDFKLIEVVGNNTVNSEFDQFFGLFTEIQLPYSTDFENSTGNDIPFIFVDAYFNRPTDLEIPDYTNVSTIGKFKINNDYGYIFHINNEEQNIYLFIMDRNGTYKSHLLIGQKYTDAVEEVIISSTINSEMNITTTEKDSKKEGKIITHYKIINSKIIKQNDY